MFGRKKNQSPRAKAGAADTLISKEAKINGNVNFTGVLYVDGYIKGDVASEEFETSLLTIGKNGHIEGEINVPHIIIFGRVKGDVHALEHVELMSESRIEGNVYYKLIEMAMGAEVNGQMLHREEKPKLLNHQKKSSDAKTKEQTVQDTDSSAKEPAIKKEPSL